MVITFADKKLEKLINDDKKLLLEYGKPQARTIKKRLQQLKFAATLEEVRYVSGNYHELTNKRKGQWACDLIQPDRLVFTPHEKPIPSNEYGQYIWQKITGVEIIEVINYHKKK
ncbi:killer suppression protein HigA [Chitinophaga sp. SYP-B3965]|uniref:type II toxin-antitoxin system RelE/ParE family toxin n=1 Tax=Chitinophaga sp. SYP-B3965 TaxID=2663120 RepID=UPI001299F376|nr:killer suppression protein HigA [Chitinophaga sp. SYP-B3965]MRG46436.1 killer suppression protein HigA [Chitinophaga sp. SYP-B3965]